MFDHPAFSLEPVAPATGPFARPPFLATWWKHRAGKGEPCFIATDEGSVAALHEGNELVMAGEPDLTDYHSPLGPGAQRAVANLVSDTPQEVRLVFDSLPMEAVEVVKAGIEEGGRRVEIRVHQQAAVIDLPAEFLDYLGMIGKKERHELRRKGRRYQEEHEKILHVSEEGAGGLFGEFVRLHRLAPGRKGRFLNGELTAFFSDLAVLPGWRTDALVSTGGRAAAAVFGYRDSEGYYLYNSAYDPEMSSLSPGLVLIATMIEQAISDGVPRFDFLKGDEKYKFRLGARPRLLYEVTG